MERQAAVIPDIAKVTKMTFEFIKLSWTSAADTNTNTIVSKNTCNCWSQAANMFPERLEFAIVRSLTLLLLIVPLAADCLWCQKLILQGCY